MPIFLLFLNLFLFVGNKAEQNVFIYVRSLFVVKDERWVYYV